MQQTIKLGNDVLCTTNIPYPPDILRSMQGAGYQVYQDGKLVKKKGKTGYGSGGERK